MVFKIIQNQPAASDYYQPRTIEPWQVIYAVHRVVNQQQVI
ncbi:hypothetical protein [Snodgrassella alvi]|nr:hypothetical protein [Snodgrassella alvi]